MIAIPASWCAAQYLRKTYGKFLICGETMTFFDTHKLLLLNDYTELLSDEN